MSALTRHLDGALILKPTKRAKNLSIRIDAAQRKAVIIVPPRVSERAARNFAKKHADWIADHLDALPPRVPFAPGQVIPLRGDPCLLVHQADQMRYPTKLEGQSIVTGGDIDAFPGRIDRYLRAEARADIVPLVQKFGEVMGCKPGRVSIKDTKSRWGSCTPGRDLSFSWRLILAPPPVLRYVVAHEAAHMKQLNHSPHFWAEVDALMPDYGAAKQWLTDRGMSLHAYGRETK